MPALNFQIRFVPMILDGRKNQTIRAPGKDSKCRITVGDRLYLYTGMRTKACKKIGASIAFCVERIRITDTGIIASDGDRQHTLLATGQIDNLARKDGFRDWPEMRDWFAKTHGLPFNGFLIMWEEFKPA